MGTAYGVALAPTHPPTHSTTTRLDIPSPRYRHEGHPYYLRQASANGNAGVVRRRIDTHPLAPKAWASGLYTHPTPKWRSLAPSNGKGSVKILSKFAADREYFSRTDQSDEFRGAQCRPLVRGVR
jgi:hypothetical protein